MAYDYALDLQRALVAALRADAGVSALVAARIYDEPPEAAAFPYLRIGNISPRPLRTSGGKAANVAFTIEAHSRPEVGRVEAARVAAAVVAALDEREADLPLQTFTPVSLAWQGQTVTRGDDGQTYAALIAFEVLLDG